MTQENSSPTTTDPWSPQNYALHATFVPTIPQTPLLLLLAPQPHEQILDLGCGDGVITLVLQQQCKRCVGIDKSSNMINAARDKGCTDVYVVDAEKQLEEWILEQGFEGCFDAVFSNAALHWMKDQESVIAGVKKCLKSGGRFVGEMGGAGNCEVVENALIHALDERGYNGKALSPWYFPTSDTYSFLLTKNSFFVSSVDLIPRPTELPTSLGGWVETFGFSFLKPLSIEEREKVKNEVEKMCRDVAFVDGKWVIGYVRLRFLAILKGNDAM